ncbi:MAG TPA: DUF255 domain-containing protein [Thermoanaerobaculia bacterium]|nr:DUF255 domain-containing protein [Thermoanaerobaculia bacterium]
MRSAEVAETSLRTNRLIHESSPYLLLHAHNPVDWYPWGEEAIDKARRESKPIFLSVGYSTCYWCHVMEREVFSQPVIAELMNRWFVSIKVDREERPDLDNLYITATELITHSAGWPNSLFLTADLKPFFAGTYFPPEDRAGLPGFPSVLRGVHNAWEKRRPEVLSQAEQVAAAVKEALAQSREGGAPATAAVPAARAAAAAVQALKGRFDRTHGGFGGPPQFPSPANLYLLWQAAESGDGEAREMVVTTLHRMGEGAIYDQLAGGFHRYTLDADWRIPHFEKMLYDNAHLGELLAVTAKATGDRELERWARGTFEFILQQMTLPGGAFKSAVDAETDGAEGAYYIWTRQELRSALGEDGFAFLAPIFGFDGPPNFPRDHYTLYLTRPLDELAARRGMSRLDLLERLQPRLDKLRLWRARRKFPLVDDKALTDWNGMMIAAMARGGKLLGEPRYTKAAEAAADFMLTHLRGKDATLLHAWRNGEAKIPAFLDDYAFFVRGLLALDEVTGNQRWLHEAERVANELEARLRDPSGGYFTSEAKPNLLFQVKSGTDGAIPSGNGVAALDLAQLAERTDKAVYGQRARASLQAFGRELDAYPQALPTLALAVLRYSQARGSVTAAAASSPTAAAANSIPAAAAHAPPASATAPDVVTAAARFTAPPGAEGWRPFALDFQIRDGWHLQANPASLDYLIPTRVEGQVRGLEYPRPELVKFAFSDQALAVYTRQVTVHGDVASQAATVRLTYQACDDRRCLPPVTRSVALPPTPATAPLRQRP